MLFKKRKKKRAGSSNTAALGRVRSHARGSDESSLKDAFGDKVVVEGNSESGSVSDILNKRKKRRRQGLLLMTKSKQRPPASREVAEFSDTSIAIKKEKPDPNIQPSDTHENIGNDTTESVKIVAFNSTAWDPELDSESEDTYPFTGLHEDRTKEEDSVFLKIEHDLGAAQHMIRVKQLDIATSNAEIAAAPEKIKSMENMILEWDTKVSFYSNMKECFQDVTTRMNKKLQMIEDIYNVQESLWKEEAKIAKASQSIAQNKDELESRKVALIEASKLILTEKKSNDFPTMDHVIDLYTQWERKYEKDYAETYAQECLIGMLVPFIMVDIFEWDPMGTVSFVFEEREWFKKFRWSEKILPKLIAKTVVARILKHADFMGEGNVSTVSHGSWALNYKTNIQSAFQFILRYCGKVGEENYSVVENTNHLISEGDREKLRRLRAIL